MDDLAERLANLSPEKRAIILRQLAQRENLERPIQDEQGLVTGPVPLLPAQRQLLTMMAAYHLNYHHYNLCTMLEVAQPLNPELAKQAVRHLLLHHDALRLRLTRDESGWQQYIADPDDDIPFSTLDFSLLPEMEQKAAIETRAAELQMSLNVTTGPILRVAYFYLGNQQPGRLLLIVHHIASDAYSLQLLVKDFTMAYQQLAAGTAIQLPPKTTSVKRRAERMLEYARSAELRNELDYWFGLPWGEVAPLPPDFPEGVTAPPRPQMVHVVLQKEETQALIRSVSRFRGSRIRDVILTALLRVFADWNGSRTQLLAMHNHGRERFFDDVDLLRTVGWLTVHPNVVLQLPETDVPEEMVGAITEQMERIPGDGMGQELLRNASGDAELTAKFRALPGPDIVFNYLGQQHPSDQFRSTKESVGQQASLPTMFRPARESVGRQASLPNLWKSDIQMIFAEIVDFQVRLHWEYSETVYRRSTIERLANQFIETLQSLI